MTITQANPLGTAPGRNKSPSAIPPPAPSRIISDLRPSPMIVSPPSKVTSRASTSTAPMKDINNIIIPEGALHAALAESVGKVSPRKSVSNRIVNSNGGEQPNGQRTPTRTGSVGGTSTSAESGNNFLRTPTSTNAGSNGKDHANVGSSSTPSTPSPRSSTTTSSPLALSPTATLVNGTIGSEGMIDLTMKTKKSIPIPTQVRAKLSEEVRGELIQVGAELVQYGIVREEDIPRMVLIGDQSSGKSSLVSILMGIKLPTSAKMSTRGPTLCRNLVDKTLRHPMIKISVELFVDTTGKLLHESQTYVVQDWTSLETEVGAIIELASLIALKPSFDRRGKCQGVAASSDGNPWYLEDLAEDLLSTNVVIIESKCKDKEAYEIMDFPGIQHNGAGQKRVRDMIKERCKRKSVAILACIPISATEQTAACLKIVDEVDPEHQRTLFCITKCDRAEFRGRSTPCWWTKALTLPSRWAFVAPFANDEMPEIHLDPYASKMAEEDAFWRRESEPGRPWAQIPRELLGVRNLSLKIDALMDGHRLDAISRQVPILRHKLLEYQHLYEQFAPPPTGHPGDIVKDQVETVKDALDAALLPAVNFDPITGLLDGFCHGIQSSTLVAIPHERLSDAFKNALERFERDNGSKIRPESVKDKADLMRSQALYKAYTMQLVDYEKMGAALIKEGQSSWMELSTELSESIWMETERSIAHITAEVGASYPLLREFFDDVIQTTFSKLSFAAKSRAESTISRETMYVILDDIAQDAIFKEAADFLLKKDSEDPPPEQRDDIAPPAKKARLSGPPMIHPGRPESQNDPLSTMAVYALGFLMASAQAVNSRFRKDAKIDRRLLIAGIKEDLDKHISRNEDGSSRSRESLVELLEPDAEVAKAKAAALVKWNACKDLSERVKKVVRGARMA